MKIEINFSELIPGRDYYLNEYNDTLFITLYEYNTSVKRCNAGSIQQDVSNYMLSKIRGFLNEN